MISIGLLVIVAVAYWLGRPDIAFWVVLFGLANGALGLIRAVTNREWYEAQALSAGVEPNYAMLFGTKIAAFAVLLWAAWFMGTAASYF